MSEVVRFEYSKPAVARPRETLLRVVAKEWLTPETLRLAFEPIAEASISFVPGQYFSLILPADPEPGSRRELRPYSVWTHPDESHQLVTVARMVKGGRGTSFLRDVPLGTELRVVGPLGAFYLRRPLHRRLVFVATGTGLVPIRSMLAELVRSGQLASHDVTLLFGLRFPRDVFALEELRGWAEQFETFEFMPTLSQPDETWEGARGRVTDHLASMELPIDDVQVYLCGNGAMVQDAVALLEERGLDRRTRRIVLEKYFN